MRNCIWIPRMFIPREGDTKWSVIAGDRFAADLAYWERVERFVGDAPSTLRFLLPESGQETYDALRDNMYRALEEEWMEKLPRGFVLTERSTPSGVRYGIVAAFDLEKFSTGRGEVSPVRPAMEAEPSRVQAHLALRRIAPLEFPHTVLLYRDKKHKIVNAILKCDLDLIYDYELMEGGGHLKGYFIPEDMAAEIAADLHTRGDPCFAAVSGCAYAAAAKAHWEEIKGGLGGEEFEFHPARYTLAEFVNAYDDAVTLPPVCRIVQNTDGAALLSMLSSSFKGRREGNTFTPKASDAATVTRLFAALDAFVKEKGGTVSCADRCSPSRDDVYIFLPPVEKEDLFDGLKGELYPPRAFTFGAEGEARYYTEGREISYD